MRNPLDLDVNGRSPPFIAGENYCTDIASDHTLGIFKTIDPSVHPLGACDGHCNDDDDCGSLWNDGDRKRFVHDDTEYSRENLPIPYYVGSP